MEKRLMSKQTEDDFLNVVIDFVIDNELTLSNVLAVVDKVIDYMDDNAVITGKE